MLSRSMQRVERSARALKRGQELLDLIRASGTRERLVKAADAGVPPVTAISADAVALVGKGAAKLSPIKQFMGLSVRAVLEEEGFELERTGVRVYDPIFKRGSVYRRINKKQSRDSSDILAGFIRSLNKTNAVRAQLLLREHLRRLTG